jgi:integrase
MAETWAMPTGSGDRGPEDYDGGRPGWPPKVEDIPGLPPTAKVLDLVAGAGETRVYTRIYMRPAIKRAGVTKPFRPFHDLRHTALTHEAAAGNPMSYIQLKAGHSQSAITERYIHAAQVPFPGAAVRGEERMFGGPQDLNLRPPGYAI